METTKKKNFKISNKVKVLAAVSLIAIMGIGGIRAYMTDHDAAKNPFTVGKVDFVLYEESWDGKLPDGSYATPSEALGIVQATDMYSGKIINKDPAIKNNSRNDAYLRMSVKVPVAEVVTAAEDGTLNNGGLPVETELFTYEENLGTGMRKVSDTPKIEIDPDVASSSDATRVYHVYEYEYTGGGDQEIPLPAGRDIPPLFDQVVFANVIEGQVDENTEFLTVDFKAIQAGGFDSADEAWGAYERQNAKKNMERHI